VEQIVPLPVQSGSRFPQSISQDNSRPHVWARPGSAGGGSGILGSPGGGLVALGYFGGGSEVTDKVVDGSFVVVVGNVDKGKGKQVVEGHLSSGLDDSKFPKLSMVVPMGVGIIEFGSGDEDGEGFDLVSSTMGSGSTDSSGPDMVPVGPIATQAEDALALVPSSGGSVDYNFQLVVHSVKPAKSSKAGTSLLSPFNTLNTSEVVSFC
jgi:hypothetical protein